MRGTLWGLVIQAYIAWTVEVAAGEGGEVDAGGCRLQPQLDADLAGAGSE